MGDLLWLVLKLWVGYLVWCLAGFAVTDRVMGRDRFFQWVASCGAMGYVYAALWPLWLLQAHGLSRHVRKMPQDNGGR